jgi:hypothetical protein
MSSGKNLSVLNCCHRILMVGFVVLLACSVGSRVSRALEVAELAGWWIAVDDALPKLWMQGAIAPTEEILQIAPDGRVANRIMNLQVQDACSESKVCSDLAPIATAQAQTSGNHLNFTNVEPSNVRLDSVAGTLLIRQEAVTSVSDWTVTVERGRLRLRSAVPDKVRNFVRIDPDRLRSIYAGFLLSKKPAKESWRCFFANATAGDPGFALLHKNRSYRRPEFVDRYLKMAAYIVAIRSALASNTATDNNDRQQVLSADVSLVQSLGDRPLSFETRKTLQAVLTYIDEHRAALFAFNTASAKLAAAKSKVVSATREIAELEGAAKAATEFVEAAERDMTAAAADHNRIQASANWQSKAAQEAYANAKRAIAVAAQEQNVSTISTAAAEAARLRAATQQKKTDAISALANDYKERHDDAAHALAEQNRTIEQAKSKAAAEQEKATAAAKVAADLQKQADLANAAVESVRNEYEAAKIAAARQQQKSSNLGAAVQALSDAVVASQKAAEGADVLLRSTSTQEPTNTKENGSGEPADNGSNAAIDHSMDSDGTQKELTEASTRLRSILKATIEDRDSAASEVGAAKVLTSELTQKATELESRLAQVVEVATSAQTTANNAKSEADKAALQALQAVGGVREAERQAARISQALVATAAARDISEAEVRSEAVRAADFKSAAEAEATRAHDALARAQAAAEARNKAVGISNEAVAEATRWIDLARQAGPRLTAAEGRAKSARAAAQKLDDQSKLAAEASVKAEAEYRAASGNLAEAEKTLKAVAARQPKSDGLIAITDKDIAALVQVLDEGRDGDRLFCQNGEASMMTAMPADRSVTKPAHASAVRPRSPAEPVATDADPHRTPRTEQSHANRPEKRKTKSAGAESKKPKADKTDSKNAKLHKPDVKKSQKKNNRTEHFRKGQAAASNKPSNKKN